MPQNNNAYAMPQGKDYTTSSSSARLFILSKYQNMSNIPTEIWCKIAGYIECPNPVLYTRLAAVSSSAYSVFTSDKVWSRIAPRSNHENHFRSFISRVSAIDSHYKQLLRNCWAAVDEISIHPHNSTCQSSIQAYSDALYFRDILTSHSSVPEILLPIVVWYAINPKADKVTLVSLAPLLTNREFVQVAVAIDGRCLQLAPAFMDDYDLVLTSVSARGEMLEYVSERLRNDKSIAMAAVSNFGSAIRFVDSSLAADRKIALKAVQSHGWALHRVSEQFLEDREIVLNAVLGYCAMLQFASIAIRSDKAVVSVAVAQQGWTLQYAAPELQNDFDVVNAAISCDPSAIKYASPNLRDNKVLVQKVLVRDPSLLQFASPRLQSNPEILAFVGSERNKKVFGLPECIAVTRHTNWVMEHWDQKPIV